jgi:hypothetical protein
VDPSTYVGTAVFVAPARHVLVVMMMKMLLEVCGVVER